MCAGGPPIADYPTRLGRKMLQKPTFFPSPFFFSLFIYFIYLLYVLYIPYINIFFRESMDALADTAIGPGNPWGPARET